MSKWVLQPTSLWLRQVRVGEHNKAACCDGAIDIDIEKIIDHPNYSRATLNNDISILKLKTPITWSNKVRPVCLPSDASKSYAGVTGVASGWGRLSTGQSGPQSLHHVSLDVYAQNSCMNWGGVHKTKICAGGKDGKAVCNGDSGG